MKSFYFAIVLLFFVFTNTYSQIEKIEVEDITSFQPLSHIKLGNGIVTVRNRNISLGTSRYYYYTEDFIHFDSIKSVTPASAPVFFNLENDFYFYHPTGPDRGNRMILRLKEDLTCDTLFVGEKNSIVEFPALHQSNKEVAFIKTENHLLRFNKKDSSLIIVNVPSTQFGHYPLLINDTSAYVYLDKSYYIHNDSANAIETPVQYIPNQYPRLIRFIDINVEDMFLHTFRPNTSNKVFAFFGNGYRKSEIFELPYEFSDTTYIMDMGHPFRNLTGEKLNLLSVIFTRPNGIENGKETFFKYLSFDTLTNQFFYLEEETQIIASMHEHYYTSSVFFKLNNEIFTFTYRDSTGYELMKFKNGRFELFKDINKGMDNSITRTSQNPFGNYFLRDNDLYFSARHPHYGGVIYHTNGTEENTGIICVHTDRFFVDNTNVFELNEYLYFVVREDHRWFYYRVKKGLPYIKEDLYEDPKKEWHSTLKNRINDIVNSSASSSHASLKNYEIEYKNGLVYCTPNPASEHHVVSYFPQAQQWTKQNKNVFPYSIMAIYDTLGNLLKQAEISRPSRSCLGADTTIYFAINHFKLTAINGDTLLNPSQLLIIGKINKDNTWVNLNTEILTDFDVLQLQNDDLDNLYLLMRHQKNIILKVFDKAGNLKFEKNVFESQLFYTYEFYIIDEDIYITQSISNGVQASCKYKGYRMEVIKFNRQIEKLWDFKFESDDIAYINGVAKNYKGEVWIGGGVRGSIFTKGLPIIDNKSTTCDYVGFLIRLNEETGVYRGIVKREDAIFLSMSSSELNGIYTSALGTKKDTTYSEWSTRETYRSHFQRWSYDSKLLSTYSFTMFNRFLEFREVFIEIKVINDQGDWIYFSPSLDVFDTLLARPSESHVRHSFLLARRKASFLGANGFDDMTNIKYSSSLKIWPNPVTKGQVFIGGSIGTIPYTHYRLVGLDGKVVYYNQIEDVVYPLILRVPFSLYGNYILQLYSDSQVSNHKIVLIPD